MRTRCRGTVSAVCQDCFKASVAAGKVGDGDEAVLVFDGEGVAEGHAVAQAVAAHDLELRRDARCVGEDEGAEIAERREIFGQGDQRGVAEEVAADR